MKTNFWKALGATSALLLMGSVNAKAQDDPKSVPPGAPVDAPAGGGQRQGGGGQRGGQGRVFLSTVPVLYMKSELKLTDEQVTKITAIRTKAQDEIKAMRAAITPGGDPMARREANMKVQEANKKTDDEIKAVLNEDQTKMLPDFMKETQALVGAGLPATTLGDLKLTLDQKKKIVELTDKMQADLKDVPRAERRAKQQELRKDLSEKAMALMTDEQKETLKKNASGMKAKRVKAGAKETE